MENSIHIAALDLGSTTIKAMVARKNEDGNLSVLASEQVASDNCIRRGLVFNKEEIKNKVSTLIYRLNRRLESPIEKVYIGVGGQSIRTKSYTLKKEVPGGIVTQELVDSMLDDAWDFQVDSLETLDVVSPEYYLDGQWEKNPKGALCSEIEARFNLVVGRSILKKNLVSATILNANLDNAGFLISPLATAEAVLSDKDKELGCALIEFGGGITSVSVYKNGLLRYLTTIPLGGDVITKDIRSLDILDAEDVKKRLSDLEEDNPAREAIEARVDEIVENVIRQLEESGYMQSLSAGIVVTGGGSLLFGLSEVLREKTGKEVRSNLLDPSIIQNQSDSCIIGLLSLGTEECLRKEEPPVVVVGEIDLFGDPIKKPEKKVKKEPDGEQSSKPPKKGGGFLNKFARRIDTVSETLFSRIDTVSETLFKDGDDESDEDDEKMKKN